MPNVTTAAAPTSSVRVPESIKRLLADPFRMEGEPMRTWTAPTKLPPDCTVGMLRDFVDRLRASLKPAPADTIQACIKALAHGTAHKAASTKDWQYQTKLYARTLEDIPSDVWFEVTKELLKTYEWFPGTAAIAKRAEPLLAERRKQLERAEATLAVFDVGRQQLAGPTPKASAFEREPREVRLRTLRNSMRRIGQHQRAAGYERELAELENREPEDWINDLPTDQATGVAKAPDVDLPKPSPKMQAALNRAAARRHREQGREGLAAMLEREADALAPEHVEEPIGDEHVEEAA